MGHLKEIRDTIDNESVDKKFVQKLLSTGDDILQVEVIDERKDNYEVEFVTDVSESFLCSEIEKLKSYSTNSSTEQQPVFLKLLSKYTNSVYDGMPLHKDVASFISHNAFIYINGVYTDFEIDSSVYELDDRETYTVKYILQTDKPSRLGRNIRKFIRDTTFNCEYELRDRKRQLIEKFEI